MRGKYTLLHELLPLLEEYEANANGGASLPAFSIWLSQRASVSRPGLVPRGSEGEDSADTILTMLISYLFRYTKHYTKKALEETPLNTMDEFTFLTTLSYQGSLTKTELIQQHLLEVTSGIEIIKRLIKSDLIDDFPDPNDRRSKRVKITEKGSRVLEGVMKEMDRVAMIFSGDLNGEERRQLMPLLLKLNDFHALIHMQDRKSELNVIEEKYLGIDEVPVLEHEVSEV
ncbi:MAG: MarR family winged helix-turn-helix transcriptional regulator [Bacteroidia bacterium]